MTVVDASVVVSALVDTGPEGSWAMSVLVAGPIAAPHLMPVEVANVLRRSLLAGEISSDVASIAHAELGSMRLELFPYAPFADRVWELRQTVTSYDAWYVALAEDVNSELATLDLKLSRACGPRCVFAVPPGSRRE